MTLTSCEPAIHPEGNAIFGYDGGNHFVRNGKVRPKGVFVASAPSGQTGFSPDEMTLRALPSGQSRDPPDGMPLRLAHQIHFGSQCATECVYRYLLAKVELKKSHFGKPPLIECTLRHPLCQSELAELRERQKPATKSNNDAGPSCEPAIHHDIFRFRPKGVFCCERLQLRTKHRGLP